MILPGAYLTPQTLVVDSSQLSEVAPRTIHFIKTLFKKQKNNDAKN